VYRLLRLLLGYQLLCWFWWILGAGTSIYSITSSIFTRIGLRRLPAHCKAHTASRCLKLFCRSDTERKD